MTDNSLSLISSIRDKSNNFIIKSLEKRGISGIVPSHGKILLTLNRYGSITKSELAKEIGREKATVTILIAKLIEHRYVVEKKNDIDKRKKELFLTKEGKEFLTILKEISEEMFSIEYNGISDIEREEFIKIINKINRNFSLISE